MQNSEHMIKYYLTWEMSDTMPSIINVQTEIGVGASSLIMTLRASKTIRRYDLGQQQGLGLWHSGFRV